ncbi:MAG: hypothetical protein EB070_10395 [Synechococcaceae bacterium WBA_2_066]|nr:hypothetical protein [Betaproteobacteria bacterium]NDE38924.1 hypothetical protein [Synechococcaceae bacterium WBA_2_066]NDG03182.1 hypothetical protein [Synechococcaceae bacterium WBB_34_004]NDG80150.1 hypothetical protein [Synechococcaceae bacterium WB8_1B_057]
MGAPMLRLVVVELEAQEVSLQMELQEDLGEVNEVMDLFLEPPWVEYRNLELEMEDSDAVVVPILTILVVDQEEVIPEVPHHSTVQISKAVEVDPITMAPIQ